jgi:hypothetical protein
MTENIFQTIKIENFHWIDKSWKIFIIKFIRLVYFILFAQPFYSIKFYYMKNTVYTEYTEYSI